MSAALLLLLALAAPPEESEEAKQCFEAGRSSYEAGHYDIAAQAFECAYRLTPRPPVIFSLAQAQRQQYFVDRNPERLKRAIALFQEYVRQVPAGGRREHALQHIADLEEQLARLPPVEPPRAIEAQPKVELKTQLMITSRTPGAQAAIGEEELSELPQIREVSPGTYAVKVEAPGFVTETVDAVSVEGRLVVVDVSLKEKPAIVRVNAPEGSDVSLDGRLVGEAPLTAAVEVPPGRHFLAVTQRGSYGFMRELVLDRGAELAVDAQLETTTQRSVSYVFLGSSAALAIAGAITGSVALRAESRAKDIDTQRTGRQGLTREDLDEYQRTVDRRDRYAPPAFALLAAGGASLITGALLYFIDSPRIEPR